MPFIMSSTPPSKHGSKVFDPNDLFEIFDSSPKNPGPTNTTENTTKGHMHRKTRSLIGFDPMLDAGQQAKPSNGKVWSHDTPSCESAHPLRTSSNINTSSNRKPPAGVHRAAKSDCVSDLQDIASHLSMDKPRSLTKEEELRYTLGDSKKSSTSKHDRKLLKKKAHQKSPSLSDSMGIVSSLANRLTSPPATPETYGKALVKRSSPTPSAATTPPRRSSIPNGGSRSNTPIQSPKLIHNMIVGSKHSPKPSKSPPTIPTLAKQSPTSFLKSATTMAPRSSEQDPSPHQVALPSSAQLYAQAKLCALIDSYREVDQNFDFNALVDVDRLQLKSFCALEYSTISGLTQQQKPIIQALLECERSVSTEGYFTEEQGNDRLEVGVFSTQSSILVVYRGTDEQQLKPGRSKCESVELDPENAVQVYPPFRDAYFELEAHVYKRLDVLMEQNPFSEIVFCGHSFGGALATIGAVRFATARPMSLFSCHAFASPKVGTQDFQQLVNTLPNLKILRVESGLDPHTSVPADIGSTKYQHVGHSLVIHASVGTHGKAPLTNPVEIYRFDHKKPAPFGGSFLNIRKPDIQAYVRALEPFATGKLPWVKFYAGENVGNGVRGKGNEKRLMV